MENPFFNALIEAASAMLVRHGDGENHTVAASIGTADGTVVTALNLYHFTGGPCAEVVALARFISEGGGVPVAIVAVGDRNRGVIAPCGRCRQILADYCPEIQVILNIDGTLTAKPVRELLPFAYLRAEQPE